MSTRSTVCDKVVSLFCHPGVKAAGLLPAFNDPTQQPAALPTALPTAPRAGIGALVDEDACVIRAAAGDGELVYHDDSGVAGPFHFHGNGDHDLLLLVFHLGVD